MQMMLIISILISLALSHKPNPEGKMSFIQICQHLNYPVETHDVVTNDDVILTIFRVQAKGQSQMEKKDKVIFWQHGLFDSSDGAVVNSEDRAPVFVLANRGYDVWVGNSRGNVHSKKSAKNSSFWKFSFHEMAKYDLPAVLSYVNQQTQSKIHYIGHSQGTAQMFAALSMGIEGVESNLLSFTALAPVAFLTQQAELQKLASSKLIPFALNSFHINEILFPGWYNTQGGRLFCAYFVDQCSNLFTGLMDKDGSLNNKDRMDVKIAHFFAGTSTQNLFHWQKLVNTGEFVDYNGNAYNLSNIKVKTSLLVGQADGLADPIDAQKLRESLVNVGDLFYKEYYMGHSTFTIGLDMSYLNDVFERIEE